MTSHMKAAITRLHDLAVEILAEEGKTGSITSVAEEFGVHRTGYSRILGGYNDITVGRLIGWLDRWKSRGHAPITVRVDGETLEVSRG